MTDLLDDDSRVPQSLRERLPEMQRLLAAAVRRACPAWLQSQADDLVQAALIKVVETVARSGGDVEPGSTYLWRVGYSAVVDEIRRHRRRREVSIDDEDSGLEALATRPDPEREAASRSLGRAIADCLERLVDDRRDAVTLHLAGHPVPEIAALLGWKTKRADNAVYRGLANLRDCLRDKGLGPGG